MDRMLIEAADKGDVDKLQNLIKEHPLLLKTTALAGGDTPLHVACIGGHVRFVKEVLNLTPQFANELNQDGLSPLHIASANGDVDTVKELLKLGIHVCLLQGRENMIPLHFAVVKGRIEVIRELLLTCFDSVTQVTARGETCFHLAVKNNRFGAFKFLCQHVVAFDKEDVLNTKDGEGNTILHLAASRKQYEVVDLLLDKDFGYKGQLEVNSLNQNGVTPLDVLVSEGGDSEIERKLTLAGATTAANIPSPRHSAVEIQDSSDNQSAPKEETRDHLIYVCMKLLEFFFIYDKSKSSVSEARNALLVMAALIATATYTAGINPPGGVWQDDFWPDATSNDRSPHTAGKAVMATRNPGSYYVFLFSNTVGLFMSVRLMLVLTIGLPLRSEVTAAFFALVGTYNVSLAAVSPHEDLLYVFFLVTWIPLTVVLLVKLFTSFVMRILAKRSSLQSTRASV